MKLKKIHLLQITTVFLLLTQTSAFKSPSTEAHTFMKNGLDTRTKTEKYEAVRRNLKEFYDTYNQAPHSLTLQARYTVVSAAINNEFNDFNFVGFYVINNSPEPHLEIGPYQSDILATARIFKGKGVCGTCWEKEETIIVNRVRESKNYIACDDVTKSEICVPVFDKEGNMIALLDVDCIVEDVFDEEDKLALESILKEFITDA